MIRTQIYLPEELHAQLISLAGAQKIPTAQLIRDFLKHGVQKTKINSGHTLEKIAKLGLKGPKNLSIQIDKYLYD